MSDPFAEFEQVSEKKIEQGAEPEAVKQFFEQEQKKTVRPNNFSQLQNSFPPERQEQAEKDFLQRQRFYGRLRAKEDEIESIMERIYLIRHQSDLTDQVVLDVKNLLAELNRLQEELAALRENGLQKFCATLDLDEIGISKRPQTSSFRNPTKVDLQPASSKSQLRSFQSNLDVQVPSGAYGFMRTGSISTFSNQPPNQRWRSLFNMFKEWRFQKQVAEAQRMVLEGGMPPPAVDPAGVVLLNEEINKLRAAIYTLRQRKELSEADANLLQLLQAKLKTLNELLQKQTNPQSPPEVS